jgi:hypothetical protein
VLNNIGLFYKNLGIQYEYLERGLKSAHGIIEKQTEELHLIHSGLSQTISRAGTVNKFFFENKGIATISLNILEESLQKVAKDCNSFGISRAIEMSAK